MPAKRRQSTRRSTKPDEKARELSFEDPPVGRIGDSRSRRKDREEFPPKRVKAAGRTGGECPGADVTADDLSPETLLDDSPSRTPSARLQRAPLDTLLTEVDAEEALSGKDEDAAVEKRRKRRSAGARSAKKRPAPRSSRPAGGLGKRRG